MMNEHQRETAFLRHCLRYDDSAEHKALDKKITQIQRDERCVQRAMWLMAAMSALALAALGYAAVLIGNLPPGTSQLIGRMIAGLGLAAMICVLVFVGLRVSYRQKLDQRREECRQLVKRFLDSRLGKPVTTQWRESREEGENRETPPVVAEDNGSIAQAESSARG